MAHRIYLALHVPKITQTDIIRWQQSHSNFPVRWIASKNLHITLVPPWEERDPNKIIQSLQSPPSFTPFLPFQINLTTVSFGTDPRSPRLIWASGNTPQKFILLKQQLETALHLPKDLRHPKTHITLARFRSEGFKTFPTKTLNEPIDWRFTVSSFVLMESHLSPTGADYEILTEFSLRQSDS